jgi:peptide deformylase
VTRFPIRLLGDAVLRRRAEVVHRFDASLRAFTDALTETMLDAEGAGLAAPQVGVPLRIFVLAGSYAGVLDPAAEHDPATERAAVEVVINPVIVAREGVKRDVEGCLSIPGIYADVDRAARVLLRYQSVDGTPRETWAEGLHAKAVQHEFDHLEGVLFLDHLPEAERAALIDLHRAELAAMQREARAHLRDLRKQRLPSAPWSP